MLSTTLLHSARLILWSTAVLALPLGLAAQDRDTILKKDGKHKTKVLIVKLDRDMISYKSRGKDFTIKSDLVSGYRFGSAPDAYTRGLSASSRENHVAAAKLFDEASKATKVDVVKQAAIFFAGRSFALASLKDATHSNNAVANLQAYLTATPNGYYMPEAKVRLAQTSLAGGDATGAETMLKAIETEAVSGNWELFWPVLIKYTLARAQYEQKKFSDARFSFQAVDGVVATALGQGTKYNSQLATLKTEALVRQGETYIGEKMYDDALGYYQTLAGNNTRGVRAAALAGQGQILYIQGVDKNDETKLRQAQNELAKASIEPDTSDPTSAKALFYMGKVLSALGDKEKGSLGRAKTYYTAVRKNYGATEWAARARKELEG